jgi:hypothetical protein
LPLSAGLHHTKSRKHTHSETPLLRRGPYFSAWTFCTLCLTHSLSLSLSLSLIEGNYQEAESDMNCLLISYREISLLDTILPWFSCWESSTIDVTVWLSLLSDQILMESCF